MVESKWLNYVPFYLDPFWDGRKVVSGGLADSNWVICKLFKHFKPHFWKPNNLDTHDFLEKTETNAFCSLSVWLDPKHRKSQQISSNSQNLSQPFWNFPTLAWNSPKQLFIAFLLTNVFARALLRNFFTIFISKWKDFSKINSDCLLTVQIINSESYSQLKNFPVMTWKVLEKLHFRHLRPCFRVHIPIFVLEVQIPRL